MCVRACVCAHAYHRCSRPVPHSQVGFGASRKPKCPRDAACVEWRSAGRSRRTGTSALLARKFYPNRGCQERRRYLQLLPTPRGGHLKKGEA
ncbi:hypothetical protein QQF64_006094 [Cirrhinus molitorella]|uniref:Uncharacterized protein n=1 Tax=Cirrhinus molitorella TaxID=172907 RepID=A0ABR3MEI5_9TELE